MGFRTSQTTLQAKFIKDTLSTRYGSSNNTKFPIFFFFFSIGHLCKISSRKNKSHKYLLWLRGRRPRPQLRFWTAARPRHSIDQLIKLTTMHLSETSKRMEDIESENFVIVNETDIEFFKRVYAADATNRAEAWRQGKQLTPHAEPIIQRASNLLSYMK